MKAQFCIFTAAVKSRSQSRERTCQVIFVPKATDLDSATRVVERRLPVAAPEFSVRGRLGHLLDRQAVGVGHEQPPEFEAAVRDVAAHLK